MEKIYTPEKSTTFYKSNYTEGRGSNFPSNNSPYKQTVETSLKPSHSHSNHLLIGSESYRGKDFKLSEI